ncbi:MAG TPA: glycosyltransferase family 4 protein [Anaerolineales bacterium]|nr:glycosyltransferase family 4 protein [Anaerolineales bacterium]
MKILFVVDPRSPISLHWIRHFVERGDEVYIASTFPAMLDLPIKRMETIPVAFSGLKKATQRPGAASARTLGLRTVIRQWLGPLTIRRAAKQLRAFIDEARPDLIHAMRIPYEGMVAAYAIGGRGVPHDLRGAHQDHRLIVSTWGNDFTLHAPSSPLMRDYTRRTMQRADAIHSDCHRDIRLAVKWRFDSSKSTFVAPGNGGIHTDLFYPPVKPVEEPIILNPRGFRPYVRNDMFFRAIPLVLATHPNAKFICTGMAGEEEAIRRMRELGIENSVRLLGLIPSNQIADVYRRAPILVSPSIHDGTPNTLLEGMACGCFPVAGDLESIREWITPNENGLLCDSNDPQSIASALIEAIENKALREKSASLNREIISTRAEYGNTMRSAEAFYREVIGN